MTLRDFDTQRKSVTRLCLGSVVNARILIFFGTDIGNDPFRSLI